MKRNQMRSIVLSCAAAVAVSPLFAQEPPQGPPGGPGGPGGPNNPDAMFLHKAGEGGLLEIQLGQLAAQKSSNPRIQAFGQKMVHDHTMLNDQLKPFAMQDGVPPPDHLSSQGQHEYDRLSSMPEPQFDHVYLHMMVMDHQMDLREFRQEAQTTQDPQLKHAVYQASHVIQEHLRIVTHLAQENGGGPGGPGGMGGDGQGPPPPPPSR